METLTVNICFASVVLPNKPTTSPRPSDLGSWDVLNKEFTDKLSGDEFLRGELDGRSCAVFDYIEWARNAWISSWFVKNQDLGSNPAEVSSFKVMSSKELQSGVWTCAKLCVFLGNLEAIVVFFFTLDLANVELNIFWPQVQANGKLKDSKNVLNKKNTLHSQPLQPIVFFLEPRHLQRKQLKNTSKMKRKPRKRRKKK